MLSAGIRGGCHIVQHPFKVVPLSVLELDTPIPASMVEAGTEPRDRSRPPGAFRRDGWERDSQLPGACMLLCLAVEVLAALPRQRGRPTSVAEAKGWGRLCRGAVSRGARVRDWAHAPTRRLGQALAASNALEPDRPWNGPRLLRGRPRSPERLSPPASGSEAPAPCGRASGSDQRQAPPRPCLSLTKKRASGHKAEPVTMIALARSAARKRGPAVSS